MNIRALVFGALLSLGTVTGAQASLVYDYTGNGFKTYAGLERHSALVSDLGTHLTAELTFDIANNWSGTVSGSDVQLVSLNNGVDSFSSLYAGSWFTFVDGNLVTWFFAALDDDGLGVAASYYNGRSGFDGVTLYLDDAFFLLPFGVAGNVNDPGVWVDPPSPTAVREPASLALLGIGLVGGAVMLRRRRAV